MFPAAVAGELLVLGLSEPSAGPAPVGVRPAEAVEEGVVGSRVHDGEEDLDWYQGVNQVFDEYTGEALPAELAKKAREEEVTLRAMACLGGDHRGRGVAPHW